MSALANKLKAYDVVIADIAEKQKEMVADRMHHEIAFYGILLLALNKRKSQLQVHDRLLRAFPSVQEDPTAVEVLY